MKGKLEKSERLRVSSPTTKLRAVIRNLVNLIYKFFFLHFGPTPFKRWLGGLALGVYNSLLLKAKYFKTSLLTQS